MAASNNGTTLTTSVTLTTSIVGEWSETYHWIVLFSGFAAFAMAFYTGANNTPIPFSSLIGSGALTFLKSGVIAFVFYVPGTALSGDNTMFSDLFSQVIGEMIQPTESFLMSSMVVVLITSTCWLAIASSFSLPVSPRHSIWAAILGTVLVTNGGNFASLWSKNARIFFDGGILWFLPKWTVCPVTSCFCAFCFFAILRWLILRRESGGETIFVFLSVYYGVSTCLLCLYVMDQVIPTSIRIYEKTITIAILVAAFAGAALSLVFLVPLAKKRKEKAADDNEISENVMQTQYLHTLHEDDEYRQISEVQSPPQIIAKKKSAAFNQLILEESSPNRLAQTLDSRNEVIKKRDPLQTLREFIKSRFYPVIKCERKTLIRHALAEKFDELEESLRFPHILASCIFAIVQCVSETSALMIPFQAILNIFQTRSESSQDSLAYMFKGMFGQHNESLTIDPRIRSLGGAGASMGFLLFGWRVTQSLASNLTYVSNSRGLVSQSSAAFAVIIASWMKLPISSVHASVAALVGVGIADNPLNVNWKLLVRFVFGWLMTVVFCSSVAYVIFYCSVHSPAYVVSDS